MTATRAREWETVVGLEVHCELATVSKLFCGCPNEFGDEPNTNICPVCLGLPGSLPVLNERAVEFALRVAEALHLRVPEYSIFSRKNYFYPDMPKDYQTSQYDEPITIDGWLEVDGERLGITRAHLEEDTGKSLHVGGGGRIHDADHSLVDYNRAGVPLLEIVSEPDIRCAEQAKRYVEELRGARSQRGRLRREDGRRFAADRRQCLGPSGWLHRSSARAAEIKNLNSLRSLLRAVEHETARQIALIESGERSCRKRAIGTKTTAAPSPVRSKEEAHDYRYFPEPDLVPVAPTDEMREQVRASMPELPAARRVPADRRVGDQGRRRARVIVDVPGLADYAEQAVAALKAGTARTSPTGCAKTCSATSTIAASRRPCSTRECSPSSSALVTDGTISRGQAKDVLNESMAEEKRPADIVEERGLAQVSDAGELDAVVDEVLAANADAVEE